MAHSARLSSFAIFFFNDTAPTEIYTLSLHDALPIFPPSFTSTHDSWLVRGTDPATDTDRKSTRLNSSHRTISYAVFCLKKKNAARAQAGRDPQSAGTCSAPASGSAAARRRR